MRKVVFFEDLKVVTGEIHIIEDRCKGCGFCVEYCPRNVLVLSEQFNTKGYHPPEIVKLEECIACQLCEMMCPEFAIFVRPQEADEQELVEVSVESGT